MSLPTPPSFPQLSGPSQAILKEEKTALDNPLNPASPIHVLVFTVNQQSYAIESRFVKEVFTIKELTPLFDMPPHFKGVTNLRRRIVAVFDLAIFLQQPFQMSSLAILLTNQLHEFALIVEAVDRTENLSLESLSLYLSGIAHTHLKGEFPGQLIFIDGKALIDDPHLLIQERVNPKFSQENE